MEIKLLYKKYLRLSRRGTDICAGMFMIRSLISRPIDCKSSDSRDRMRVFVWSVACSLQRSSSRLRNCWTHSRFCFSVIFKTDITPNTSLLSSSSSSSSSLSSASTSLCWTQNKHFLKYESCGLWCCVVGQVVPNGSKDHSAFTFRVMPTKNLTAEP